MSRARIIDWLLLVPYGLDQIGVALSRQGQRERRDWWLQRRPSVVHLWNRPRPKTKGAKR